MREHQKETALDFNLEAKQPPKHDVLETKLKVVVMAVINTTIETTIGVQNELVREVPNEKVRGMAREVFSVMDVNSSVIEHCNEMPLVVSVHESDGGESAMVRITSGDSIDCGAEVIEAVINYCQMDENVVEDCGHY